MTNTRSRRTRRAANSNSFWQPIQRITGHSWWPVVRRILKTMAAVLLNIVVISILASIDWTWAFILIAVSFVIIHMGIGRGGQNLPGFGQTKSYADSAAGAAARSLATVVLTVVRWEVVMFLHWAWEIPERQPRNGNGRRRN